MGLFKYLLYVFIIYPLIGTIMGAITARPDMPDLDESIKFGAALGIPCGFILGIFTAWIPARGDDFMFWTFVAMAILPISWMLPGTQLFGIVITVAAYVIGIAMYVFIRLDNRGKPRRYAFSHRRLPHNAPADED
jgi:hypothetical protein